MLQYGYRIERNMQKLQEMTKGAIKLNGLNIEQVVENIYNIAKTKNIKIKDIEFQIGVSTGYLSRLLKPNGGTRMSADVLVKLAEVLGVSLDQLLNYEVTNELTDSEKKIIVFIQNLIDDTQSFKLNWKRVPNNKFEGRTTGYFLSNNHPLTDAVCLGTMDGDTVSYALHFNSVFNDVYGEYTQKVIAVFETWISKNILGYNCGLVIAKLQFVKDNETHTCYELKMLDKSNFYGKTQEELKRWSGDVVNLCSAEEDSNVLFKDGLTDLYACAENSVNHIRVDERIMSVIDSYNEKRRN